MKQATKWARRVFGAAQLGDIRRTNRLVRVAAQAARTPAGKITEVFTEPAERQASYDLLESTAIGPEQVTEALAWSSARACGGHERVLVAIDGTSLSLTDRSQSKGFGHIGSISAGASGVKLMNALALTEAGTPIGIADQIWWTREERAPKGVYRKASDRESVHWRNAVTRIGTRFAQCAPDTKLHFLADREADAALLIHHLLEQGHEFTIRSNGTRKIEGSRGPAGVRAALRQRVPVAMMNVTIPAKGGRRERVAQLTIRAARFDVRMRDRHLHKMRRVPLTYIWAREAGGLDWLLVTNTDIRGGDDACDAVRRYTRRWRIEDFHRTWKSGLCNVEDSQLRSTGAIIKWATILAAVASRAEELRRRSRETPDELADAILSPDEIEALVALKTQIKRRNETVSREGLSMAKAIRWIADLGGYVGNKASGPPGAITIGRGLKHVEFAARLIAHLRTTGQMR